MKWNVEKLRKQYLQQTMCCNIWSQRENTLEVLETEAWWIFLAVD